MDFHKFRVSTITVPKYLVPIKKPGQSDGRAIQGVVCHHSIPGIAGSNSSRGMAVRLLCLLYAVYMAFREDLPVVCAYRSVI